MCSPKITRGIKTNFDEGIEFFDDHQHHNQGIELYAKYFTHCDKKHDVVMDSSSNLSMYPQQVYDIYLQVDQSFMSRLKLITVVREPISRMFTNHRSKATSMPFDEYSKMLVQSSKFSPIEYGQHLKTWTSLFGRNQLLVLSYEELQTYPTRAHSGVCNNSWRRPLKAPSKLKTRMGMLFLPTHFVFYSHILRNLTRNFISFWIQKLDLGWSNDHSPLCCP